MRIPLSIRPAAGSRPSHQLFAPVTFGVPLPRGGAHDAVAWTLSHATGHTDAVDVRVLDRWPDGSIRWALVDAQIDAAAAAAPLVLDTAAPAQVDALPRVSVTDRDDGCEIHTGVATFVIRRNGRMPFDRVAIGGVQALAPDGAGLTIVDEHGATAEARVQTIVIEHRSRLRATVRLDGNVALAGGRRLQVETRVEFFLNVPTVRVRCTIRNPSAARHPGNFWDLGDPGSILIKDAAIGLPLAFRSADSQAQVSADAYGPSEDRALPIELYQDSSGGDAWQSTNHINRHRVVPNTFQGYRLRTADDERLGRRATPALLVRGADVAVGLAVPEFWQNFPMALEATADALVVRFWPHQYADLHELQGGEQKTYECFVTCGSSAMSFDDVSAPLVQSIVSADPSWIVSSGAVDFLAPLDFAHGALVASAIDGPDRFEQKREIVDEFGWRHFGDVYGDHETVGHTGPAPLVSHYNNQYDPVAGFALQFLRTGDGRWWHAMSELARHVIDIDIYHTQEDKAAYSGGLFWHTYHYGDADTATHRTYPKRNNGKVFGGGPSADHNYPTGLMLFHFLSGDIPARDAAVGLAEYVIRLDDGRRSPFRWLSRSDTGLAIATAPAFYGPARASGNSLNALVDGHRLTGDARFLEKAEQVIRRVVHPQDDIRKNQLDEPEIRWFYAMFLQALGKYLHHRAERGLIDKEFAYARDVLLHYARWMAEHEYPYLDKPEKLEYPTETWAAQDIRKSDIFYFAAMHAAGGERERFLERARFFHRHSIETLATMPTRVFARPVIVLLTSGFMDAWAASQPMLPSYPVASAGDVGRPEGFVPQRVIAVRRAKWIAVTLGGLAVLVAVVWLLS